MMFFFLGGGVVYNLVCIIENDVDCDIQMSSVNTQSLPVSSGQSPVALDVTLYCVTSRTQ